MLALIGFIVLVVFGLLLFTVAGVLWFGTALLGGKAYEVLIPVVIAVLVFWLAFSHAPFTVAFTG